MVGEDRIRTYPCYIAPDFTSVAVSKSLSRLNYGSGPLTTWIFTLVGSDRVERSYPVLQTGALTLYANCPNIGIKLIPNLYQKFYLYHFYDMEDYILYTIYE